LTDLKPDNIFLHCRDDGRLVVKILDFGIARYAQELLDTGDKEKLTATQAMLGTPLYMAPEQAKAGEGRAEIGPCTDVWAVGMIVFELLNGAPYWNADSLVAHLGQLLFAPMAPASQRGRGLPAGFDAWFARSCSRDSSQRYATVSEQIAALASLLVPGPLDAEPPPELVAAVRAQIPPLIDHRSPTMPAGSDGPSQRGPAPWREIEEGETRILAQRKLPSGSAEQSLRAELLPGQPGTSAPGPLASGLSKSRAPLAAVAVVSLAAVGWVLLSSRMSSGPGSARLTPDLATAAASSSQLPDLAAPPPPPLAPEAAALPSGRKPADSKRPSASKSGKGSEPRDAHSKPRRTYVPPSL
jgi:serine/threonine-protein kinase